MRASWPVLQAIVDVTVAERAGWSPEDLAAAYLDGGATFLQIRSKHQPSGPFLSLCDAVVARALAYRATVIVNDRADLAMLSGADGVHVGQEDLSVSSVRRVVGDSRIVGLSTHDDAQLEAVLQTTATYVAVGPVFGTQTKDTGYAAVGLERVRSTRQATDRPVVAIGGITIDNARSVVDAGADMVAIISDLLVGGDPRSRVASVLARLADR